MNAPETIDFPFFDVVAEADKAIEQGGTVYQKFTCAGCGNRLTMETPNVFHRTGSCDSCNVITNIVQRGCNYMLVMGRRH